MCVWQRRSSSCKPCSPEAKPQLTPILLSLILWMLSYKTDRPWLISVCPTHTHSVQNLWERHVVNTQMVLVCVCLCVKISTKGRVYKRKQSSEGNAKCDLTTSNTNTSQRRSIHVLLSWTGTLGLIVMILNVENYIWISHQQPIRSAKVPSVCNVFCEQQLHLQSQH